MHELSCHERGSTLPKPGRREAPVHQRAARSVDVPRRLTLGMTPSDPRSMRTKLRGAKPVHHEQETSGRSTKHVNTINELRNSYCPHGLKGIPCIPASGGSTSSNDFNSCQPECHDTCNLLCNLKHPLSYRGARARCSEKLYTVGRLCRAPATGTIGERYPASLPAFT